jgi:tetratricopeptide (TPR) repeat protein
MARAIPHRMPVSPARKNANRSERVRRVRRFMMISMMGGDGGDRPARWDGSSLMPHRRVRHQCRMGPDAPDIGSSINLGFSAITGSASTASGRYRRISDAHGSMGVSVDAPSVQTRTELAACLDALRKRAGWTYPRIHREQKKSGSTTVLSRSTVHDMCQGKVIPTEDSLWTFLEMCEVPRPEKVMWIKARNRVADAEAAGCPAARGRDGSPRLGRSISACRPLELEVHPSIKAEQWQGELPLLPTYVQRLHDVELENAVKAVAAGASRIVMLVGGPSTGKTRACWEAVQLLPDEWTLWHPLNPTRPEAILAALPQVEPRTVVWLNEAQHYLLPDDLKFAEPIAAGLRALLTDPERGPILVLGTIWPKYWQTLTVPPGYGVPDPFDQARVLLFDADIRVAESFNGGDLARLRAVAADDPRLRQAADYAEDGRVTQYLAGVPELLRRYRNAPPVARAVIHAAMDARRFGHPARIPHALLATAASGYLADAEWHEAAGHEGQSWNGHLAKAFAYVDEQCHGTPGPVTRIHPRPNEDDVALDRPCYRLADYLDQAGRIERVDVFPPASFWRGVAATITDSILLRTIGSQAQRRGRYHRAAQLYRQAADRGDVEALLLLAALRGQADDSSGAEALYRELAIDNNPTALRHLAMLREQAGDRPDAELLYQQAASVRSFGRRWMALRLIRSLERSDDQSGVERILHHLAFGHGDTQALWRLVELRTNADDRIGVKALYQDAANGGNTLALWRLVELAQETGDHTRIESLYQRAADRGQLTALRWLAGFDEVIDASDGADALAVEAAARGDTARLMFLAECLEKKGENIRAESLYRQAADHGETFALLQSARLRELTGDRIGAESLVIQAAERGNTFIL